MVATTGTATSGAPGAVTAFTITLPTYRDDCRLILVVTGKYETTTIPTINQGWTLLKSGTGGQTPTTGADVGQMFYAVYGKDVSGVNALGTETAPTVTPGGTAPDSWNWVCMGFSRGAPWSDSITTSASWVQAIGDTTTASPLTGTIPAFGAGCRAGDAIFVVGAIPTDLGSAQTAGSTITSTGLSGGTITQTGGYVENALGADTAMMWATWTGFTGTQTAGTVASMVATSATNLSGVLIGIAMREDNATVNGPGYTSAIATQSTTSPKSINTVAASVGDLLMCWGVTDTGGVLTTPTGGTGLTWTLQDSYAGSIYLWSATATTAETPTISMTNTGSAVNWTMALYRSSAPSRVGSVAKAQGTASAPRVTLPVTAGSNVHWGYSDSTGNGTAATVEELAPDELVTPVVNQNAAQASAWATQFVTHKGTRTDHSPTVGVLSATADYGIIAVEVEPQAPALTGTASLTLSASAGGAAGGAPTQVAFVNGDSDWDTTSGTTRTITFSNVQANDRLVIVGAAEDGANLDWATTPVTNDGTGLTWAQSNIHAGNQSAGLMATATVDANRSSLIVSVSRVAGVSAAWGAGGWLYRGSDGVGTIVTANNAGGSGQPSLGVTTTQANSAICCLNLDWNATAGARTYRQVNGANPTENRYDGTAGSNYIVECYSYANAGAAGAQTIGLTVPSTQRYVTYAVEVKGTTAGGASISGGAPATGLLTLSATAAGSGAAVGTGSLTFAATGDATIPTPATGSASLTLDGLGGGRAPLVASGSLSLSATAGGAARAVATGSMTLTADGVTQVVVALGTAQLVLSGAATARAPNAGTGALTLAGVASAAGAAIGFGSLSLSATGEALVDLRPGVPTNVQETHDHDSILLTWDPPVGV